MTELKLFLKLKSITLMSVSVVQFSGVISAAGFSLGDVWLGWIEEPGSDGPVGLDQGGFPSFAPFFLAHQFVVSWEALGLIKFNF